VPLIGALLQVRAGLPINDEGSRRGVSQHPKTDLTSASRRDLRATYVVRGAGQGRIVLGDGAA
jgi:hypothetical protein